MGECCTPSPAATARGSPAQARTFLRKNQNVLLPWSGGEILKAPLSLGKGAEDLL